MNLLILPYKGKTGENIIKHMEKSIAHIVPPTIETKVCYTSTKLSSKFSSKDITKAEHHHKVVYMAECPEPSCNATYVGETARRIEERAKDHAGRDQNSHLLKHSIETQHPSTTLKDFKIIGQSYRSNHERKIGEALHIKRIKPNLNIKEKSYTIRLLN